MNTIRHWKRNENAYSRELSENIIFYFVTKVLTL